MKGYSPPRSVQPVVFVCQAPDPTLDTSAHPGLISALTKATSKLTLSLSLPPFVSTARELCADCCSRDETDSVSLSFARAVVEAAPLSLTLALSLFSFFRQGKELGFPPAPVQVRPHILWVPRERKATEQALSN